MDSITDKLWITDIQGVREKPTDRFDRVITCCQDSVEDNIGCEYEFFCMADGEMDEYIQGNNSYEMFSEAAESVVRALENDEVVLVHCHAGRSRSAAVSIAALGVVHGEEYYESYRRVKEGREIIHPDGLLVDHARRFIKENNK